jgi:hypothetical protein
MWYTNRMETTTEKVLVSEALDLSYPPTHQVGDTLAYLIKGLEVHPEVLDLSGPGGGWPVYRFHGTRLQLVELYSRYYGDGNPGDRADFAEAVATLTDAQPSTL